MQERELEILKGRIQKKLERTRRELETVIAKDDCLTKHGFWDMGYLRGQISVLVEWLDELDDIAKESEG